MKFNNNNNDYVVTFPGLFCLCKFHENCESPQWYVMLNAYRLSSCCFKNYFLGIYSKQFEVGSTYENQIIYNNYRTND